MKVENEIAASTDGIVKIATTKGAKVETGDILAYIR
jgi:biotin carboxyl carrier protein